MARELLLIRHGIAVERGSTATDEERALTAEGRARTRKVLVVPDKSSVSGLVSVENNILWNCQCVDVHSSHGFPLYRDH